MLVYQLLSKFKLADGRKFSKHDVVTKEQLEDIMLEHTWINVRVLYIPRQQAI